MWIPGLIEINNSYTLHLEFFNLLYYLPPMYTPHLREYNINPFDTEIFLHKSNIKWSVCLEKL